MKEIGRILWLGSVALCACGPQKRELRAASTVPSFHIDEDASEITIVNATSADDLAKVTSEALDFMVANRSDSAKPARYQARVTVSYSAAPYLWPFILATVPLGGHMWLPGGFLKVKTDLVFQIGNRTFRGAGADEQTVKLMSAGSDAYLKTAVWNSVQQALDEAKEASPAERQTL